MIFKSHKVDKANYHRQLLVLGGHLSLDIVIDLGWSSIGLLDGNLLLSGGFMHWCGNGHALVLEMLSHCIHSLVLETVIH